MKRSSTQIDTGKPAKTSPLHSNNHIENDNNRDKMIHKEDLLLEKLLELEAKLKADQNRKSAHQKQHLQAMWRKEISRLQVRL